MNASDAIAGYRPPNRADYEPVPATGHMPFPGHRTQKEVREQKRIDKHRKLGRTCSTCGKSICDESITGLCKSCFTRASNADPELRRRRGETLRLRCLTDPDLYARKCALMAASRSKRSPESLKAAGERIRRHLTPEIEAKRKTKHAQAMRRRRHPWLPDDLRPLYQKMLRNGGYRAPEAKRIILDHIKQASLRAGYESGTLLEAVTGSQRLRDAILGMRR